MYAYRYSAGHSNVWKPPPTTSSISSTKISRDNEAVVVGSPETMLCLPMFASQCPGWICYVEKSQPQAIPYISTTKSPQQIFGRIAREILHESDKIARSAPYIVSVQPCFDKKLEASRRVSHSLITSGSEHSPSEDFHRISITMKMMPMMRLIW
jgi:hypothetical protein